MGGEIVSADSMQVYRGMDIGTAKPTPEERRRIPHHLLDVVDPDEPFDASRYCDLARGVIARLHGEGKPVFVVGGTGLYIRALLGGLIDGPGADESLRQVAEGGDERWGTPHLYEKLRARDPQAAARIHPHDGVRIIRALEVLELTGRSIVDHQKEHRFRTQPYEALRIGLMLATGGAPGEDRREDGADDRRWLCRRRCERLLERGYERSLKPMQSLGYRHLAAYLAGEVDLEGAVRLIKRDTRRYAKRQMTWFAADPEIIWLAPDGIDAAAERIGCFLGR